MKLDGLWMALGVCLLITSSSKGDLANGSFSDGPDVLAKPDSFTLADLTAELPSTSPQLIKKVLAELKCGGQVKLDGRGRGAVGCVIR